MQDVHTGQTYKMGEPAQDVLRMDISALISGDTRKRGADQAIQTALPLSNQIIPRDRTFDRKSRKKDCA